MAFGAHFRSVADQEGRAGKMFGTRLLMRRPESGAFVGLILVYVFFGVMGTRGFISLAGTAS